jgi:hypothetical protein
MKKQLFFSLVVACAGCHANGLPVLGVIEQIPVTENGPRVIARPIYILTDQKLDNQTVFSGLQGVSSTLTVVCCYEVKNTTPTSLDAELARYGKDSDFASQMKSVKGYRYVYIAEPTADKTRWTPLMKTLAKIAANPEDASPFSAAVVGAQFEKPSIPASFMANGVPMTMQTRVDKKSDRLIYTFTRDGKKIEFSEDSIVD